MDISTSIKQGFSESQSSMSCIQAMIEYTENFKSKLASFVSDDNIDDLISLAVLHDGKQKVIQLSKTLYDQALNDLDSHVAVPVNDAGNTILVASSTIADAVEEVIQENTLQNEFLKYCIDGVESKTSDFLSIITSKYASFSGVVLEKYSQLISSNPLQSLSNFCNLFPNGNLQRETQGGVEYLTLVSTVDFANCPNVWLLAIVNISKNILSFFEGVFDNFYRIGEVFQKLGKAVVNLMTWLVQKVSANLLTVYEKGDKKFGIMDFPVFQIPICKYSLSDTTRIQREGIVESISDFLDTLGAGNFLAGSFTFWDDSATGCRSTHIPYGDAGSDFQLRYGNKSAILLRLRAAIATLLEQMVNTDANDKVLMPLDIIIPCSQFNSFSYDPWGACDVVCRFGPAHDETQNIDYLALQVFVADSFDNWNSYNDYQNYERIWATIGRLGDKLSSTVPLYFVHLFNESEKSGTYDWSLVNSDPNWSKLLMDLYQTSWGENNISIADHTHCILSTFSDFTDFLNGLTSGKDLSTWSDTTSCFAWIQFILGLLTYCAISVPIEPDKFTYLMYGDGYKKITYRNIADKILEPQVDYNMRESFTVFTWYGSSYYESSGFDNEFYYNIFKPYSKYSLTPAAIHLQSNSERVKEAQSFIYKILIAVAAVIITVKLIKFRKNRINKQALAQAQADSLSWDVFNPEKDVSVNDYIKARKKANRITRVNGLLGFSSPSQLAQNTNSVVDGVMNSMFALSGQDMDDASQNQNKYNLKDIFKTITGNY